MNPAIAKKVLEYFIPNQDTRILTAKENEVLKFLADGLSYKMIADKLAIGYSTAVSYTHLDVYKRQMYRFANIDSRWRPIMHKSPLVLSSLSSGKYELEFGIYNKFDQKITIQKKLLLNICLLYTSRCV